jgi:hypothetical protein|tara:strand:+ start:26 stop:256 length:231 start_codon:yes stop_codon:yes gene_type:complete
MKKDKVDFFFKILLKLTGVIAVSYLFMIIYSCNEDTFIGGYNKDLEEIHYQMFEVDSLIMTIQMELDSLNAKNWNK